MFCRCNCSVIYTAGSGHKLLELSRLRNCKAFLHYGIESIYNSVFCAPRFTGNAKQMVERHCTIN